MGASEAHALVAFLTAPPDNGVEGWLVGAIKTKVSQASYPTSILELSNVILEGKRIWC